MNKKLSLPILVFISIFLSGCTPILWILNDTHQTVYKNTEVYSDNIRSAFEYKNASLSIGSGSVKIDNDDFDSDGIGFVGDKNVYFVTSNGDVLLLLNNLMKAVPLRTVGNDKFIDINLIEPTRTYSNAEFSQYLNIRTRQSASSLTAMQKELLTQEKFTLKDGYYQRLVEIKGIIINKARLKGSFPNETALKDSYQVRFNTNKASQELDGGKLAFNVVMTPVTLTGDIILLPVYLLMMMNG
ncbi:YidX family protein [Lelliottia wanjuensis]|uniref:hypothetical protein n=1 Tax=Lelliottia wanjuensis TaxID=3050585 RepID=UPI00254F7BB6|nr:hypothetical protein [Lelliottia sp. V104_15]MDK9605704.1 hypothetical protein [Lelliottia sp. V104_15]